MEEVDPAPYLELGRAFRTEGDFAGADDVFAYALEHCSRKLELTIEYAWSAHYKKDWQEALRRWISASELFSTHPVGPTGVGRVLLEMGRLAEAEEHLAIASKAFPGDRHIATTYARSATMRQDWVAAYDRWTVASDLDPNADPISEQRGKARWHIQQATESHPATLESAILNGPAFIARVEDSEAKSLVLNFESLGENCEFGLVQRRFEAEPLGLLRWTYTGISTLLRLLESKFSSLGKSGKVEISRSVWKEYFLRDTEYGIVFHTFLNELGTDEPTFLRKQEARLRWLSEKLLSDLSECKKIFVYKVHHGASEAQIAGVFAAMQKYGLNRLLCVRIATEEHRGGTVGLTERGLLTGYLSRLGPRVGTNEWDIPCAEWLSICRSALQR